ncbi:DEAD/DEAH box helicase family protein [Nitrospirillum sp. BR 11164]|uniref:DEAD/DEAH box helicase family protein n=1 Tax=Nitrospirillum sp. BR 11164 TaxID=3104324 RepID=UPI002AFF18B6|nr:DEAD/DEAH box helicase family protein [Nitrospirillum sp. BR 11164]MEA1649808.1 DEAD/DEAH box helicase family protein [Nitrospirillum sp. BR 11164]
MSHFDFLRTEFAELHALAARAERLVRADARAACFYARLTLEGMVKWLYRHDRALRPPYDTHLDALLHAPEFQDLLGQALLTKAKTVKQLGNKAAHDARPVPPDAAVGAVRELFHLCYWLARSYGRTGRPAPNLAFDAAALPRPAAPGATVSLAELQATTKRLEEAERAREEAERARLASEAEREKLKAEIAAAQAEVARVKAANMAVPDPHDYDEEATRDTFIDLLLREAGWALDQARDREYPVTGMPNATGQGFVDYVLWGEDGRPLAVVEAKRTRKDARVGQQQAKLYADCLEAMTGQRPVIFFTSGYEHWLWDDRRYPPRAIQGFLTREELALAIQRRTDLKPLAEVEIDRAIAGRPYQTRAIRRVAEAFETDGRRRALLVMATGAGKTRTVIALADLLMRANWAKRVLFLADRQALVKQAVNAFKRFLPSAAPVNLLEDKAQVGRVYVSTYPTMMTLIDQAMDSANPGRKRFGPGHFDLIVIDEAHRSVYRKYGAIFDWFDAALVGLTATPKDEVDRDTYRLFSLQSGVPTDAYGLDEAVADRYLVPPKAVSVPLRFQRDGIRYDDLAEEEKDAWDAVEWEEDGTVPREVDPAAVNKWLFNADTVDKVLQHLMTHGLKVANGDRLGKTIIFAKNHHHARFIVERFDANYPHLRGSFCRVIDNQEPYAQTLIDDFSAPGKAPHIAVSVDMLDTGIDVPEVVNLVFFKIVRSKTKFWQMVGRGTRLCPDLFGPDRDKDSFLIFDFCQNLEFFKQNPDMADGALGESLGGRLFNARLDLLVELDRRLSAEDATGAPIGLAEPAVPFIHQGDPAPDQGEKLGRLRTDTADRLRLEVAAMPLENFIVRPHRRLVEIYGGAWAWARLGPEEVHALRPLAGLPSGHEDGEPEARQFDLLILRTQLALLQADRGFIAHRRRITDIASLLEELANVPMVAAHLAFIQEIQSDDWWQDATAPMLETIRRRLRDLVKLIEVKKRPIIYTDFEDEIGTGQEIELPGVPVGTDMDQFRKKARGFLRAHQDHIAIAKLRRNEPLTPTDLTELERMLIAEGADTGRLDRIRADGGLGLFVRSLVGLDREAAKQAFAAFEAGKNLTANQLEFLTMIIDHLTERGVMEPSALYESPFTDINPLGITGIFGESGATELISIIESVRQRAVA